MNYWAIFLSLYVLAASWTFWPIIKAIRKKVNLDEAVFSFKDCEHFTDKNKVRLEHHFDRLRGTLVFWKNTAAKYGRFHYYSMAWTIAGGISIPVLAQAITSDPYSKWSLTVISTHIAILYVSQKGFKVEHNYKSFRLGESDFYDLRRKLLDMPKQLGETEEEQILKYFELVAEIRENMRLREVDGIPSFDELRSAVQQNKPPSS